MTDPATHPTRRRRRRLAAAAALALAASAPSGADALEFGNLPYAVGADTLYSADLPAVNGFFLLDYSIAYHVNRINDVTGKSVFDHVDLNVGGSGFRPIYVWEQTFFGARQITESVIPLLYIAGNAQIYNGSGGLAFQADEQRFSPGDVLIAHGFDWHYPGGWSFYAGAQLYFPTGNFSPSNTFNLGTNIYTIMPNASITWRDKRNNHFSTSVHWGAFQSENTATRYQNGQYFTVEMAAGVGLTEKVGLDLTAFTLFNASNDRQFGLPLLDGNQTRKFGIGPQLRFNIDKSVVAIKYQHEFDVRNAPKGERFWIQFGIPLYVPDAPSPQGASVAPRART